MLSEPFGRLLDRDDGADAGTYGKAGARTETFAIGSIYYTLLRGHEPYEIESWGEDHFFTVAEKFQRKEFPPLSDDTGDTITRKCWDGEYQQVSELLAEFGGSDGQDESGCESQGLLKRRKEECEAFIESGVVEKLDRH